MWRVSVRDDAGGREDGIGGYIILRVWALEYTIFEKQGVVCSSLTIEAPPAIDL